MREITKNILNKAVPPLLVIAAVAGLSIFTNIFKKDAPVIVTPPPVEIPSEYSDFDAYSAMQKKIVLVENKDSYTPANLAKVGRTLKTITTRGQFSRAYLYVKASVDNGKPLTQWDSIYTSLEYTGGQLFRPSSLKIRPGGFTTELLYGLNQIQFIDFPYSESKTPKTVDWFGQINTPNELHFDGFLSSLRAGGHIDLIEIRYECAVNSDCSIN